MRVVSAGLGDGAREAPRRDEDGSHHRHDGDRHDVGADQVIGEPHPGDHEGHLAAGDRAPSERHLVVPGARELPCDELAQDECAEADCEEGDRTHREEEAEVDLHRDTHDEDGNQDVLDAAQEVLDPVLVLLGFEVPEVDLGEEDPTGVRPHQGGEAPAVGDPPEGDRRGEGDLKAHCFATVQARHPARDGRSEDGACGQRGREEHDRLRENEHEGYAAACARHHAEEPGQDEEADDVVDGRDSHDQLRRSRGKDPRLLEEDRGDAERGRGDDGGGQRTSHGREPGEDEREHQVDHRAGDDDPDDGDHASASRVLHERLELGLEPRLGEEEPDPELRHDFDDMLETIALVLEQVVGDGLRPGEVGETDPQREPPDDLGEPGPPLDEPADGLGGGAHEDDAEQPDDQPILERGCLARGVLDRHSHEESGEPDREKRTQFFERVHDTASY